MDLKKVKSFIKLAKEEGVTSLKYEENDVKFEVSFRGTPVVQSQFASVEQVSSSMAPVKDSALGKNIYEVKSPLVGTFYSSSSPDKPAYIKVGDKVKKGSTLCILEAMKIMNEIECEVGGEIIEVCVENESLVEYDQVLFRVRV